MLPNIILNVLIIKKNEKFKTPTKTVEILQPLDAHFFFQHEILLFILTAAVN